MSKIDLFGNILPDKTKEEEYKEYIASPIWKRKREDALERARYECEECGMHKGARRLEVHHLTYERFKNERPEDLKVLCEKCHPKANKEREQAVAARNFEKLEEARYEGWARKVYGDDWMLQNEEYIYEEYRAWSEKFEF